MLLTSGSLNFYTVQNKLLFYGGSLVRTFWVFERKQLTYRKLVSALIWLNEIAFKSNASVIRQIIIYVSMYMYIFMYKHKDICPFLLAVSRGEEHHKVGREGSAGILWRIQVSFKSYKTLPLPAVGCSHIPPELQERRTLWLAGCSRSRWWMLRLCKELQMLPLTHAGSFCSDRSGSQALCNVHCHILSASTVMSAEGKD